MLKRLISIATVILFSFLVGCTATSCASFYKDRSDDIRFVNIGRLVGDTLEEVQEKIGIAHRDEKCAIPIPSLIGTKLYPGKAYIYESKWEENTTKLMLCVVYDYVISEHRTIIYLKKGVLEKEELEYLNYNVLEEVIESNSEIFEYNGIINLIERGKELEI